MAWSSPDTPERVAEQMSRGVFRDGAWYRRQADGSLAEWPVLRLDRLAAQDLNRGWRELRADAFVTFALNPDGTIDQAKMRAVSPATDFSYDFQDLLLRPVK